MEQTGLFIPYVSRKNQNFLKCFSARPRFYESRKRSNHCAAIRITLR